MKTNYLFPLISLLFTISIYGQDKNRLSQDFSDLKELNQKFIDYQALKVKISKEEKDLIKLKEQSPPTQQNNQDLATYSQSLKDKKELLTEREDYPMFTQRAMDKMFIQYQSVLSGSGLQNGAVKSLVASLDDKGIQFSYNRRLTKHNFFYNLSIAGKTEEANDDGFLTIFSKNKFLNNNIVYSAGGDVFWFFKGSKSFTADQKESLHLRINDLLFKNYGDQQKKNYNKIEKVISEVDRTMLKYNKIDENGNREISFAELQTLQQNLKKLKEEGIIKTDNLTDKIEILKSIKTFKQFEADTYSKNKILMEADSLQIKANSNIGQHWLALGAKYNVNAVDLLDSNFPSDSLRIKDYTNDYVSLRLSYNYFRKFSKISLVFSPTINFSNQRNFKSKDLMTSQKIKSYNVAGSEYQISTDDPVQFYERRENRVNVYSVEFPTSLYMKEMKFGFDLNFKVGVNDPNNNNISAKFGVYVPIKNSENKVINIEPLIRFVKLFSSGQNNFIKDNVQVGFILAVTLPTYTKI
ncbi:hypothetical protein H9Q08_03375 [Chryseobacterium sp. PS-8]|uniref:EF-hand domain-containing protein n=1 Tax=Chryseobacterium indicum TaxID=2766954 RepID=A0ABS9C1A5_9FLAO|nr:hypothetical protein [Chryseobacterium sp. PS-8]MCF2218335.1 hypothetical protein [Chryseobacterium sp. PS-8]